jgi:signal transduction histidine kinase/serine phosphatase RsbU (regulator of sigma subunit)
MFDPSVKKISKKYYLLANLTIAFAYFSIAKISITFASIGPVASIWPSSGIALAALLLLGIWVLPGIFLGSFLLEFVNYDLTLVNLFTVFGISLANTLGPLFSVFLLRYFRSSQNLLEQSQDVLKFVAAAALSMSLNALIGASTVCLSGNAPWTIYTEILWTWWISDTVGMIIFTPLLLAWSSKQFNLLSRAKVLELALLITIMIFISYIAFGKGYPVEYTLIPVLMWSAFRFEQKITILLIVCVSLIAILGTANGYGSFVRDSLNESLLLLQSFIAVITVTTLVLLAIIIERKKAESQLKTANAELQDLNKLKDEFLANTSHELRTPLNGIIGIAESLVYGVTGKLGDETKQNLLMIVASGKRLSALVNDILDFSNLKHKTLELQLKPVTMREIVEIILSLSQPMIAKKELQLINSIKSELPPVYADENRLQQILYNLVGNAIKFTESGRIEISAKVVDNYLEVSISDTGIGVAKNKLNRIFESFEQAEGSTARKYGGTGLGLAITKQLVQLHGGKIWVKSEVGVGSCFFFTIPLSKDKDDVSSNKDNVSAQISLINSSLSDIKTNKPSKETNKVTTSNQVNILIVDDEPINLQVLQNYLYLENYHIVQANNGHEALSIIEKGFKPDAILLDVMMPQMTGYELTKKLREKWQADELPILLLTAKNQVTDLVTGLEAGANDYLAKPFSKDELLARLKNQINIKQLRADNIRLNAEIEVTQRIQQMLLPKTEELEKIVGLDIAGFMEPAEEVGGDYYDVLQSNGRILFCIGDATGHGLESGMLAMMTQAGVRTLLEIGETDTTKFLTSLNSMIYKNVQERMLIDKNITLSLLEYQAGGTLRISGQHEDIIIVRNGNLELFDTSDLGVPVGFIDDISEYVSQKEVKLNQGDVVILYTDGITEAENIEREEYGIERLSKIVKQHWQKSSKDIQQAVIDDVHTFIGTQKVFDDITLLVLKQID